MKLAGSAARLSPEEADRAHAHTRVDNYLLQLTHLESLYLQTTKERGMTKAQLDKARAATAVNLAEAMMEVGNYEGAATALNIHAPKHPLRKRISAEWEALKVVPDDQHCNCPVEHLIVKKRIRDRARDIDVDLIHCAKCGHMNATATPPERLLKLHEARRQAAEGETDAHVFTRAEASNGKKV